MLLYLSQGESVGSIVDGACRCGYEKKEMCLGGGMLDSSSVVKFPYYCEACEEVVVHNTFMKPAICRCGQVLVRYDNPTLSKPKSEKPSEVFYWNVKYDEKLVLTDNGYLCPKCKEYTLKWFDGGYWN